MATTYRARDGSRFVPARGTVLVRPDEGPDRIGNVFLTDRERRFEGYRKGLVVAVGEPKDGQETPPLGVVVHYDRMRDPSKGHRLDRGVQLGDERLVLLWSDQCLGYEVPEASWGG